MFRNVGVNRSVYIRYCLHTACTEHSPVCKWQVHISVPTSFHCFSGYSGGKRCELWLICHLDVSVLVSFPCFDTAVLVTGRPVDHKLHCITQATEHAMCSTVADCLHLWRQTRHLRWLEHESISCWPCNGFTLYSSLRVDLLSKLSTKPNTSTNVNEKRKQTAILETVVLNHLPSVSCPVWASIIGWSWFSNVLGWQGGHPACKNLCHLST